jgi:hypothetical protein
MVIKSAAVRTRRKVVQNSIFFRKPRLQSHLQARSDELNKQEFLRASSAVSFELRPDAYVFLSDDFY